MGSLFKPNFERKLIDSDQYFTQLIAYIHNNPVHHGFLKDPADWPYSSWHAYLLTKPTRINRKEGLEWFGDRDAFKKFHQELNFENLISIFEE